MLIGENKSSSHAVIYSVFYVIACKYTSSQVIIQYLLPAIVVLKDGQNAEKLVSKFHMRKLLGTQVEVALYPLMRMLCLSHLPDNMEEEAEFAKFLEEYGPLEKSFLIRNAEGEHALVNILCKTNHKTLNYFV